MDEVDMTNQGSPHNSKHNQLVTTARDANATKKAFSSQRWHSVFEVIYIVLGTRECIICLQPISIVTSHLVRGAMFCDQMSARICSIMKPGHK